MYARLKSDLRDSSTLAWRMQVQIQLPAGFGLVLRTCPGQPWVLRTCPGHPRFPAPVAAQRGHEGDDLEASWWAAGSGCNKPGGSPGQLGELAGTPPEVMLKNVKNARSLPGIRGLSPPSIKTHTFCPDKISSSKAFECFFLRSLKGLWKAL